MYYFATFYYLFIPHLTTLLKYVIWGENQNGSGKPLPLRKIDSVRGDSVGNNSIIDNQCFMIGCIDVVFIVGSR